MNTGINPFTFMMINMTIVFAVLIGLWAIMKVIQVIDPTKKKSPEPVKKAAAPKAAAAPAQAASGRDEVVAVIVAAIEAMGYGSGRIASVRPAKNAGWTTAARMSGVDNF